MEKEKITNNSWNIQSSLFGKNSPKHCTFKNIESYVYKKISRFILENVFKEF